MLCVTKCDFSQLFVIVDCCTYLSTINMTYQSLWWYPNYIEYGAGMKEKHTWPQVMEQYRRPDHLTDLRHYDLPTEQYNSKLYYRLPHLGVPKYRGLFRDKPYTVLDTYPQGWPAGQPKGFHGREYYEQGPPQFKYEGPKEDKLYWLERHPYLPAISSTPASLRDAPLDYPFRPLYSKEQLSTEQTRRQLHSNASTSVAAQSAACQHTLPSQAANTRHSTSAKVY